ncbi:superantigen-like protein [Staphylococcus condimenti]|uniref:Superantigen-like protein n=1 Tax=Staphylococcus condimenti TaxID=70255 RepID=A0A143P8S7_9STAP|nr:MULTISPECIES: exotoxin beta-grasp domain-containing protein [Staphylococcus]AMY04931.1 hypothetical protein A4G25_02895 [Staphylococcus condimenti]APR61175.1 hypothetical protein BTZ13_08150 [Staphylococcus condimenti]MDK8645028.1 exotoxin beta-grasp domain-containing protein [Staphylococcus condimenti]OFP01157.1 hypothetical protein HMPREF3007_10420 [Staphylococcus sp. HMSC065E08]QQS83271.1 superantigen-like protein [Staphylococcus condimenti]
MKKTAIIKASLASLVIGTGLFTSTAQASEISLVRHTLGLDQKPKQTQQNTNVNKADREDKNVLLGYYTQQTTELTNLTGYTKDSNKLEFVPKGGVGETLVTVSPNSFSKYKTDDNGNPGLDVFVVRENTSDRGTTESSIGGVTKTNTKSYKDPIKTPYISVKTTENGVTKDESLNGINFNKEEVSLKEVDFKLRKLLIDQKGLYKSQYSDGTIIVHLNNGGRNTFELHKKLQDNRMSDVINSTDIQYIEVTLTK